MSVIVEEELGKEFGSECRRIDEKLELDRLILKSGAYLQRSPRKTHVLEICIETLLDRTVSSTAHENILIVEVRIFSDPVNILLGPLDCIFLISTHAVRLSHRGEPFVAVELPSELIVLYRPKSPVYILSVVI